MNLVTVFQSPNLGEIAIVKSLLEESGIVVINLDETIGSLAPHHTFGSGGSRLAVDKGDVEDAKEIIQDYLRNNE